MQKKSNKKNKENNIKGKNKVDYLRLVLIIVLVYFSITFVRQQLNINEYNVKISSIKEDIDETKAKIEELQEKKEKVNDAKYIEKIAREELGLVKPYEKIFVDVNK